MTKTVQLPHNEQQICNTCIITCLSMYHQCDTCIIACSTRTTKKNEYSTDTGKAMTEKHQITERVKQNNSLCSLERSIYNIMVHNDSENVLIYTIGKHIKPRWILDNYANDNITVVSTWLIYRYKLRTTRNTHQCNHAINFFFCIYDSPIPLRIDI